MTLNKLPALIFSMLLLPVGAALGAGCGDDAPPVTGTDSGTDTSRVDSGPGDAGTDVPVNDTGPDVAEDAPIDAGPADVVTDAEEDVAPIDGGPDGETPDAGEDADGDSGPVDSGPADVGMDTPPDAGPDTTMATTCPEGDLGMMLGDFVISGSTIGASDSASPSCISRSEAPDMGYTFTAPATGRFGFSTEGSGLDTVLYVLDGASCGTTELACNDDAERGTFTSAVTVDLTAGQVVVVMVDAWGTGAGRFTLSSRQGEDSCGDGVDNDSDGRIDCADSDCDADALCTELICDDGLDNDTDGATDCNDVDCCGPAACATSAACCADVALGTVTGDAVATGNTEGGRSSYMPSCGSSFSSGPDESFAFTAPTAGDYTFDTCDSSFDTVLWILDGNCTGPEIACSDDDCGSRSSATITMTAGQTVVVVVDGYSSTWDGDYVLDINGPAPP